MFKYNTITGILYKSSNNILLLLLLLLLLLMDQIRVNKGYNLRYIYESDLTNVDEDYESPFSCINCDYYEPDQFSEKTKDLHNSTF